VNLSHAPANIRSSRKRMKAFEANISQLAEWKLDRDFHRNFEELERVLLAANDGIGQLDPRHMRMI